VQEKSWKQNNSEPEMAKVTKTLHKSIQVWHQSTKGLARQQLEIENYSSLKEKKQPRAAPIYASKFYRFVPYRDSTQIMVFAFVSVTDRESTQKRIHKLLLEKKTEKGGERIQKHKTSQTQELFQELLKLKLTKNINKKETTTTTIARGGNGGGEHRKQTNGSNQDLLLEQKLTKNCQQ
jgi:hypothetical protein